MTDRKYDNWLQADEWYCEYCHNICLVGQGRYDPNLLEIPKPTIEIALVVDQ